MSILRRNSQSPHPGGDWARAAAGPGTACVADEYEAVGDYATGERTDVDFCAYAGKARGGYRVTFAD
jgi:hypothetical protein